MYTFGQMGLDEFVELVFSCPFFNIFRYLLDIWHLKIYLDELQFKFEFVLIYRFLRVMALELFLLLKVLLLPVCGW